MPGFDNFDGVEHHAMTPLDHHDPARDPITEQIFHCKAHRRGCLAATDDINPAEISEIIDAVRKLYWPALTFIKRLTAACLRIDGFQPGRKDITRVQAQFFQRRHVDSIRGGISWQSK